MAYDQTYYFPIKDAIKEYDLYFVGALGRRLDFFETLLSRIEHLNLNIRIDGPMSFLKRMRLRSKYPLLYKHSTGRPANHVMINECYNKSKICLGIMPRQADSGFSTRTYEICGSGALQLTDGNKEVLESLFTIDREILHFNNMEELVGMIDQIIRHYEPGSYKSIANAGHLKALHYHTFETRIKQVLEILKVDQIS
jgi:spore maturation protein CgeB